MFKDWYFGKDEYDKYGSLISDKLSGCVISKKADTAEMAGGLIYYAKLLGIDMWDLLSALEGMCYNRKASEISDSEYVVF